jgi:hypothetical protein
VTSLRPFARVALGLALLLAMPCAATAQSAFDDSPWRATAQVNEVTYRIWIDEGGCHSASDWKWLQRYYRFFCFRCTPASWGATQIDRALNAAEQNPPDYTYQPLDSLTFILLNIECVSGPLHDIRPVFRGDSADSVVFTLRDGRSLAARAAVRFESTPHLSFQMPTGKALKLCMVLMRLLEPVTIFRADELSLLTDGEDADVRERYGDHPRANQSLLPVPNEGRSFTAGDLAAVHLVFQGVRIDLQDGCMAPAYPAVRDTSGS